MVLLLQPLALLSEPSIIGRQTTYGAVLPQPTGMLRRTVLRAPTLVISVSRSFEHRAHVQTAWSTYFLSEILQRCAAIRRRCIAHRLALLLNMRLDVELLVEGICIGRGVRVR